MSDESGNKTKEGTLASELVSIEIVYPCFIKAVTSTPIISFTTMNFLGYTTSLTDFG